MNGDDRLMPSTRTPPVGRGTGTVRVVTINLWGRHGSWADRQAVLADGLRELEPDLVALQESIKTADFDQVVELLGDQFDVIHGTGREADGVGASIASRWPIGPVQEADLHVTPRTEDFPWCKVLAAEIDAPQPLGPLVFVHHKPVWQAGRELERELQAVASARFVEGFVGGRDVHVLVAGDFDATPDSGSLRFWTGRQSLDGVSVRYDDAWETIHGTAPGHTFTPENPMVTSGDSVREFGWPYERGRRIDYVLVRCGDHGPTLDVTECARILDEPVGGVWPSDHFGVMADFAAGDPQSLTHPVPRETQ
jgi:endonuclease/exonuclease/phosphatase family metal-dependent hydrolase